MRDHEAILARVREYRLAARALVEADDVPLQRRLPALVELANAARREADPTTRGFAEGAVAAEATPFLEQVADSKPPPVPRDPWRRAQRALRAAGYDTCPRCLRPVATERELVADADRERDYMIELAVRAGAVDA